MGTFGQLTVQLGDRIVMMSSLTRDRCTIGRLPDNDVVLPSAEVSPHHAEIRIEPQGAVITDIGSERGTVLNGERLAPQQPGLLTDGMTIEIGAYVILFRSYVDKAQPAPETVLPINRTRPERNLPDALSRPTGYLQYLPVIFHDNKNDFLARYLQIFEAIWEPLEQRQDHISMYFDSRTCPADLLPWFASWFGLTINPYWPEARRRALLFEAIQLYRWRGTKYGLARMIEVCTGLTPEITDAPEPFVFRIRVSVPNKNSVILESLEEVIRTHKPAHAGYLLEVM